MPLATGARLGPYEIVGALGAGGMGEVYRARDTKLNRDVAIKVLPASAAADAERRERFEREAQAIAALNHPNIVTIYSIEQMDPGVGPHAILVMELVVGRSLADVLPKEGCPLDRLLKIAIPVLDAVVAAHQKGITHRDLKPGNIMLGEGEMDGRVKVLDFGLAKLAEAPAAAAGVTMMPTAPITGEGRILGTVAYMSPEQAEGKAVDARTDLFSLGVILYEMATGQRPFTGDTSISIISSIVKDTPKSITEINPVLPSELGRIVRRALTKDPERRYQTAKDLRNDLEELRVSLAADAQPAGLASTLSASVPIAAPSSASTPASQPSSDSQIAADLVKRHRYKAAIGAIVVLLALAVGARVVSRRGGAPNEAASAASSAASLQDLQVTQLTTSGNAALPAVSPDGKFVAYLQRDGATTGEKISLWVRQSATNSNVQIVPAEPNVTMSGVTVTPDGNFVDFLRGNFRQPPALWRVSFLGGMPKRLIDDVWSPIGWSPDGQSFAFVRTDLRDNPNADSLIVANADGLQERVIARRQRPSRFASLTVAAGPFARPAWSPDGRAIALTGSVGPLRQQQIVVVDLGTGSERTIALPPGSLPSAVAWLDAGSLVLNATATQGSPPQLWRVSYPSGQLTRLTNDVNAYQGISLTADRSSLATTRIETRRGVWVAEGGGVPLEVVRASSAINPGVGWGGERLLYVTGSADGLSIAIGPSGRGSETILAKGSQPAGTADGRTIVFRSAEPGKEGLWKIDADGRQPVRLAAGTNGTNPVITPDDRTVVYLSNTSGTQSPWTVSIDGGTPSQLVNVYAGGNSTSVSPDGHSLLFSTTNGVVMCGLPKCNELKTVSLPPNYQNLVRWSPDGGITYIDPGQSNLWVQSLDGKAPRQLTHFDDAFVIRVFEWSHDGKRLAINRENVSADIVLFKGLKR